MCVSIHIVAPGRSRVSATYIPICHENHDDSTIMLKTPSLSKFYEQQFEDAPLRQDIFDKRLILLKIRRVDQMILIDFDMLVASPRICRGRSFAEIFILCLPRRRFNARMVNNEIGCIAR